MRRLLLVVLLLSPLAALGQDEDLLVQVPFRYRAGVERALLRSNDEAFRATFAKLRTDPEREAWGFLLANLPPEIADSLKEPVLTEHIRCACQAWRQLPWAESVPKTVFLHWVLPIRPGGVKVSAWRKRLYDELVPVLVKAKARNLEQAAIAVDGWVAAKVKREETVGDPPPPLTILDRGHGRTDEQGVLFVAAARAVGIPARVVSTPWWTFKNGGGRWCEAYAKGRREKEARWHHLEPGSGADALDEAPFSSDAKRAAIVLARTIGRPETTDLISSDRDGSVVNSVANYTSACRLTVKVRDAAGKAVSAATVCLYIFNEDGNNAHLRGALTADADGDGTLAFDIGPGDYIFHARDGRQVGWGAVRSVPGKTATCEIVVTEPKTDEGATYERTGQASIRLYLGSGGGGDMTACLSRVKDLPWFPFGFVGGGGQTVEVDPGFYAVTTAWRRTETTVAASIQIVEVRRGETVTLRTPNLPNATGKAQFTKNAFVLQYPRR